MSHTASSSAAATAALTSSTSHSVVTTSTTSTSNGLTRKKSSRRIHSNPNNDVQDLKSSSSAQPQPQQQPQQQEQQQHIPVPASILRSKSASSQFTSDSTSTTQPPIISHYDNCESNLLGTQLQQQKQQQEQQQQQKATSTKTEQLRRKDGTTATMIKVKKKVKKKSSSAGSSEEQPSVIKERLAGTCFYKLLRSRKYQDIIDIIKQSVKQDRSGLRKWLFTDTTSYNNKTYNDPLHEVLIQQAPIELVDVLLQKLRELTATKKVKKVLANNDGTDTGIVAVGAIAPEEKLDEFGQVPLHIAVSCGSDAAVIIALCSTAKKGGAWCRDQYLRYPLHTACMNPKGMNNGCAYTSGLAFNISNNKPPPTTPSKGWGLHLAQSSSSCKKKLDNMLKVIEIVVNAFPDALMARDKDGKRPIDIARQVKADQAILNLLLSQARILRRNNNISESTHNAEPIPPSLPTQINILSHSSHHHTIDRSHHQKHPSPGKEAVGGVLGVVVGMVIDSLHPKSGSNHQRVLVLDSNKRSNHQRQPIPISPAQQKTVVKKEKEPEELEEADDIDDGDDDNKKMKVPDEVAFNDSHFDSMSSIGSGSFTLPFKDPTTTSSRRSTHTAKTMSSSELASNAGGSKAASSNAQSCSVLTDANVYGGYSKAGSSHGSAISRSGSSQPTRRPSDGYTSDTTANTIVSSTNTISRQQQQLQQQEIQALFRQQEKILQTTFLEL